MTLQCKKLQDDQNFLQKKIESLKKYEDYLDTVIKANPDLYQDLSEIHNRYRNLMNSNEKLTNYHKEIQQNYESLKLSSTQYEKKMNEDILQLNNDINDLQKKLEDTENERNNLQSNVEATSKDASTKNLNLGRILIAIDNLYSRCTAEGVTKIRYDFEEKQTKNEKELKAEKEKKAEKSPHDDDEDFAEKGRQAVEKLKGIGNYMSDFRDIIDACRSEIKKSQEEKKKK